MRSKRLIDLHDMDIGGKYEYNYLIDGEVVLDPYVKALAGRRQYFRL